MTSYIKPPKKKKTQKLFTLISNSMGGALIKTNLNPSDECFTRRGQGLYAWVSEDKFREMEKNGFINKAYIKYGQYGANARYGKLPQETITEEWKINDAIVIIWAVRFSPKDLKDYENRKPVGYFNSNNVLSKPTAYTIENIVNKKLGIVKKDGSGRETFFTTLKKIQKETNKEVYGISKPKSHKLRLRQKEFTDKFIKWRLSGGKQFLLGAIMRWGKNFAWLTANKKLLSAGDNLLVLTSKPKVFASLKEDIKNHVYFANWEYFEIKNIKDKKNLTLNPNKISVVAVSTQLANNKVSGKETKCFLKRTNFKDVLIDESHTGTDTLNFNKLLDGVNVNHKTFASGTPYKTLVSRGFTVENSYIFGYIEQQKDKSLDIINGITNDSVTLSTWIMKVLPEIALNPNYLENEQFRISKLFAVGNDGEFIFPGDVKKFIENILNINATKNSYSPYRMAKVNMNHTVWLLPTSVKIAKATGRMINEITDAYYVIVASGNDKDATVNIKDVKTAIEQHSKTITLTIGRFVEGTSVKEWHSALVFSETRSSVEKYFQFIFRTTTPDTNKNIAAIFDFNPQRVFKMSFEMAVVNSSNEKNPDVQKYIIEYLENHNIFSYLNGGVEAVPVDIKEILNEIVNGDYRAATLTKKYDNWINSTNISNNIDLLLGFNLKGKTTISATFIDNGIYGGKVSKKKQLKSKKELEKRSNMRIATKNLIAIVQRFPFLSTLFEDEMEVKTVTELLRVVPDEAFLCDCKVPKKTIHQLIDADVVIESEINPYL